MNTKELHEKLPGSWTEVKLQDFQKLGHFAPDLDPENHLDLIDKYTDIISLLTGVAVDVLQSLPFSEMANLIKKVSFMNELPGDKSKSLMKWKKIDEVTFDDFVAFLTHQQKPLENLHHIIKAMSKEPMTEDQVLNLNMQECFLGFQKLQKHSMKSLNSSIRSTAIQLLKQLLKNLVKRTLCKLSFRKKSN